MEYKYGQTLGKKLFRLKVVDIYRLESPILLHSLYRNLTKFFLSRQLYLGYFWYLLSDTRQTWHDVVAKTYVVRSNWRGEILPGGPSSYEKKPFLFILSFIFVMAAFVSLIFISVYLGFNLEEQNLRVSDFAKKEDFPFSLIKKLSPKLKVLRAVKCGVFSPKIDRVCLDVKA